MPDWHGLAGFIYAERLPFGETWAGLTGPARESVLGYWIRKAARDPWAFRQLLTLAAELEEAGEEKPEELRAFMLAYLRGESAAPKGWKSDPREDVRIAFMVQFLTEHGISQNAAWQLIGEALNKSPKTVESAQRRGESV